SVNLTSQTSDGLTQIQRFISAAINPGPSPQPVAGRLKNGQDLTAILFSSSDRAFRSFSLNPVPTLPANLSFPFSLTPTRSAPMCFRSPAGRKGTGARRIKLPLPAVRESTELEN